MKKLLLLLCTLFVSVSAWADVDYYVFSSMPSCSSSAVTLDNVHSSIKATYATKSAAQFRFLANNVLTIAPKEGYQITKVRIIPCDSRYTGYQSGGTVTSSRGPVNWVPFDAEAEIWDDAIVWEGTCSTSFTMKNTKVIWWKNIEVYYEVASTSTDVTVSAAGYTSFFDSEHAIELPTGVEGWVAYMDGSFNFEKEYEAGDVVPAGTGIVLKADAGNYTLNYSSEAGVAPANNDLMGCDWTAATTGPDSEEYLFYALSTGSHGVGFYWLAEDGAAFTSTAYKAYLPVKKSAAARSGYGFDEASAISAVETEASATVTFNLAGQRVENAKGLVIMNGKKVFVK